MSRPTHCYYSLALLLACLFAAVCISAQSTMNDYKLRKAPHILEGMMDPSIDFSVVKLRALYPLADSRRVRANVVVTDRVFGGPWPDTFIVDEKLMRKFANGKANEMLRDYFRMELMVFRAKVNGKTNFGYGIPVFRTDTVSSVWSKYLIDTDEAVAAVRALASLKEQGYSGEVVIQDSQARILAEGTLKEGKAIDQWTYRYFGPEESKEVLQERKIDYQYEAQILVFQAIRGQLDYQYKSTSTGFKEMKCSGSNCNLLEETGNRQIHKWFSRKDGTMTLISLDEGYLDSNDKLVRDGVSKSFDRETGKLTYFTKYKDGKDVTTSFDLRRRGLKRHKRQGFVCGGGISIMVSHEFDTIHATESSLLRRVVMTHTGDPQYPPGEVVPVDTFFESWNTKELSSFKIKDRDTVYLFRFSLERGYGVRNNVDLASASFSDRTFYPSVGMSQGMFWPLYLDHRASIRSDSLFRRQLSNGVVINTTGMRKKKKHGPSVQRYATGQVAVKGQYFKDEAIGEWTFYNWDGQLSLKLDFDQLPKREAAMALVDAEVWSLVYPFP